MDGRLILWDLEREADDSGSMDDDGDGDDPKELLFSHYGHWAGVSDFSWGVEEKYLLCSVSNSNDLQIWQLQTAFYLDDSDSEGGGVEAALPTTHPSAEAVQPKSDPPVESEQSDMPATKRLRANDPVDSRPEDKCLN